MHAPQRTRLLTALGLGLAGLALSACGGGGSGSGSGSNADFGLSAISIQSNATVQINRKIEFTFTKPVDFSTVNLNTISITQVGGAPAAGDFRVKMQRLDPFDPCSIDVPVPNVIVFQPACPTLADYSDAGFTPGGVQYQINVVGSTTGGLTVRSTSGEGLGQSQTLNFTTPVATQPEILFIDPVVSTGPRAIVADPACTDQSKASYLEIGGDPQNHVKFVKRPMTDANLGADVDVANFLAPLNFYSDASTRVTIVLQIDQPVNPSSVNVSDTTIKLQYLADETLPGSAASWVSVPHSVSLEQNCSEIGARIRITPTGILPQGRVVRVIVTSNFQDIVGNGNILDTVVGSFRVRTATDPGTMTPGLTADAFTEEFNVGGSAPASQQDTTTTLDAPPADWGSGQLRASFNFGGTGGPGGMFDYVVPMLPGNGSVVLNTTFQLISNPDHTLSEAVINGQVDVRNLTVATGGILEIVGPNPCVIRASGRVQIDGKILLRGTNNRGVTCFSCANLPESGSAGTAGGGRGGTGNYLTTQSTPQGETGFGPFNQPGGGGQGGESEYGSFSAFNAGGGGGGAFAIDVPRLIITSGTTAGTTINQACPDQTIIGLDAEDGSGGFQGPPANSAVHPGSFPAGGHKGPRPFVDLNPSTQSIAALDDDVGSPFEAFFHLNDFWGTMRVGSSTTGSLITGELSHPWAGAGGGGGGDIALSTSFPTTPFTANNNLVGAGGGGGGGSLTILCLGDIVFGAAGRIDASGGTGGGGENTSGFNRLGGASGGGSGGHVVLQAGNLIDFSLCQAGSNSDNFKTGAGIFARGGEGGEGSNGVGGAHVNSLENNPIADMLPPNSYPSATAICGVLANNQGSAGPNNVGTIIGCGGDGGPGLIQLHVSSLDKIHTPTGNNKMRNILRPPPVGCTQLNIETPAAWNQLLPIFGRSSKAESKWIPLGSTSVPATGSTPKPIMFFFDGTDTGTGLVESTAGTIPELPAILTGALVSEPALPFITADQRSVVFDASTITDDVYLRNPALLGMFELKVVGTTTSKFDIASAAYDSTAGTLRVTVSAGGMPLNGLTGTVSVIPRFFRVSTEGTLDSLPTSATIKIEFQATTASGTGQPDANGTTMWVTDINSLNASPSNTALRFFRFRVGFEIGVGSPTLDSDTPIPALEFLRVPFKF